MLSLNDKHIIVNYHYVRDPSPDLKGIHPCSPVKFRAQVDFLAAHYRPVSIFEVIEAVRRDSNEHLFALTFDDGLSDQYENAFPFLANKKIPAVFFPITSTFEGKLPSAYQLHILMSKLSVDELINRFNSFLDHQGPDSIRYRVFTDHRLNPNKRLHEDIPSSNLKETLMMIPDASRMRFLDAIFRDLDLNEESICRNFFMSPDKVKEASSRGFLVGGHSHRHNSMEQAGYEFFRQDIQRSQAILKGLLGSAPRIFSYPHGRHSETALRVLKEEGICYALTNERRPLQKDDNDFLLPRYDSTDINEI